MWVIGKLGVVHSGGPRMCEAAQVAIHRVAVSELQAEVYKLGFCSRCAFTLAETEVYRRIRRRSEPVRG